MRKALAFEFPLPWPDEAAFLSQAFALSHTGSFRVFALNPDRVLMWMPPGYMVVLAAFFKTFGYSFGLARWVSAMFFVAGYGCCILTLRRLLRGVPEAALTIFSATVFLTPYVIVSSNIARMESLYSFLLLLSLLLSVKGLPALGLGTVLATCVIHFNAVYFITPYAVYVVQNIAARRSIPIGTGGIWALATSTLVLVGYGIFCLLHIRGFISDMDWQFALKASRPFRGTPFDAALMMMLTCIPVVQLALKREVTPAVFASLYGAAFFFMAFYGQEMWYRFGYQVGILLSMTSLTALLPHVGFIEQRFGLAGIIALLGSSEVCYGYGASPATAPLPILMAEHVVSRPDLARVSSFIRALPPNTKVSFAFGFDGVEPFFFADFAKSAAVWTMHTHSATQFDPTRSADYRVRCDSILYKKIINPAADGDYPRQGRETGCDIIKWKPADKP